MAYETHIIERAGGSDAPAFQDRHVIGVQCDVPNLIGGGAGQTVTTAVTFVGLPAKYSVHVTPNQDATVYVTTKTATGFNVVLAPRLAVSTLAAGTFDVYVVA